MPTDLVIRPGTTQDLSAVAELYLAARAAAAMPAGVHSDDEVRRWVRSWDLSAADLWLALAEDVPAGFARATPTWLDELYVLPDHRRAGIGSALLDVVKATHPSGFGLWVFAVNRPARDFYARHGLREAELTDGSGNEEGEPDIRMHWTPGPPGVVSVAPGTLT